MSEIFQDGVRLPKSRCPYCDTVLDGASGFRDGASRPTPGDWSICIKCSQVLVFRFDLTLGKPTPEQQRLLDAHPAVKQRLELVAKAVRAIDRTGKNRKDWRRLKRERRRKVSQRDVPRTSD